MIKFNPKEYQGSKRITRAVAGSRGVSRLWVWDTKRKMYDVPPRGKIFEASRWDETTEGRVRPKEWFETLEAARKWQSQRSEQQIPPVFAAPLSTKPVLGLEEHGPLFRDVVIEWRRRSYPGIRESTQGQYEKLLRLHLSSLFDLPLYELTSKRIDKWLTDLRDPNGRAAQRSTRSSFDHEIGLLSTILRSYQEYQDDDLVFRFPVKQRHHALAKLNRRRAPKPKDLTEVEFALFDEKLKGTRYGYVLSPLARFQYHQALRVSEGAGVYHEDIELDLKAPYLSRACIKRSVVYLRVKGFKPYVGDGFKNSDSFDGGVKELPIFPESYEALLPLWSKDRRGLIFHIEGQPIGYRTIQHAYDWSFKAAGLPYTATHCLRHGFTREIYNETPDLEVAKQLLGDTSNEAARVYAVRRASAITKVAEARWRTHDERELSANVRKSNEGEN